MRFTAIFTALSLLAGAQGAILFLARPELQFDGSIRHEQLQQLSSSDDGSVAVSRILISRYGKAHPVETVLKIHSLRASVSHRELKLPGCLPSMIKVSPSGKKLCVADQRGGALIADGICGRSATVAELPISDKFCCDPAWSADEQYLALASLQQVAIFDIGRMELVANLQVKAPLIPILKFVGQTHVLAWNVSPEALQLYDCGRGIVVDELTSDAVIRGVSISHDGISVAMLTERSLSVQRLGPQKMLWRVPRETRWAEHVQFVADDELIATVDFLSIGPVASLPQIVLRDLEHGEITKTLLVDSGTLSGLIGSSDRKLDVWSATHPPHRWNL